MDMDWLMGERKVSGGMLLRIKMRCARDRIVQLHLEGDFFIYPEEALALLEGAMSRNEAVDAREDLRKALRQLVQDRDITIIGFSIDDLVEMLGEIACSATDDA